MGDSRKADYEKYEMAPTTDPEKGGVDGQQQQAVEPVWTGLGKEELLRIANTRSWNWSRNILLVLFWLAWLAMLVAAIVIVVKVPRCPEVEWWEKSAVYQVFPRSFRDSDGDGVGDITGMTKNLDYLQELGVKVVYVNSIYEQPNVTTDIGYDIVNFTNVDPLLGNLTHFDNLVMAMQEKEMKLILEFVPNHSSDKHPWFVDSMSATDSMYSDYYVWANSSDDTGLSPPNDWENAYGESAWTYVADRGQFYYHRYLSSQPDLNYNNASLNQAMMDAMKFWLDRKIDGFVFANVDYLVEPQLISVVAPVDAVVSRRRRQAGTNAPATEAATTAPTAAAGAPAAGDPATTAAPEVPAAATDTPTPTAEPEPKPKPATQLPGGDSSDPYYKTGDKAMARQDKLASVLKEWRSLLHNASYLGKYRLMVTQSKFDLEMVVLQYGKNESYLADFPLNTGLVDVLTTPLNGENIMAAVDGFIEAKNSIGAKGRWNTWALGSHDTQRLATRVGEGYVRAMNMLLLTLPGTPFAYYGDELGVEDGPVDSVVDPVARQHPGMNLNRDPERAPLPWSKAKFGNFTTGNSTWVPLPANFATVNIEAQQKDEGSSMKQFATLAKYHAEPSIVAGDFIRVFTTEGLIAYVRAYPDWPTYLVAMNVGETEVTKDFHSADTVNVQEYGTVIVSTTGKKEGYIGMDGLKLAAGEAILVEFPPA